MINLKYLIPGFILNRDYLTLKFLGLTVTFYWPCVDWSWGIELGIFGHGIACDKGVGIWLWHEQYEDFWRKY